MKDFIIEQIERRARLDHGGDVNKAAAEYFRDYPEEWRRYRDEVNGVNKRAGENREKVNAEVHYRIEHIAYRDHLDLQKLADLLAAQTKLFAEDLDLYIRSREHCSCWQGFGDGLKRFCPRGRAYPIGAVLEVN